MPEENFQAYQDYLGQSGLWPHENRLGDFEQVPIGTMGPGHAINALHKLLRWGETTRHLPREISSEAQLRRTPLAMSLLLQAVGVVVVYEDDLPPAPHVDDYAVASPRLVLPGELTLEMCFDALAAITSVGDHPVTRARQLRETLLTSLGIQTIT